MNPRLALFSIALLLLSTASQAATVEEIIEKIDDNQSLGIAYMLTVDEIEQLEKSDDPAAHYYLGLVYAEGETPNTARDQCIAAEYMYRAALEGYPYAQMYLSYAHIWGFGVEHSLKNAITWANQSQKELIAIELRAQQAPSSPYNFEDAEKLLDRSLECSVMLNKAGSFQETQIGPLSKEITYKKPCLVENHVSTSLMDRWTEQSGFQMAWLNNRDNLAFLCSPKNRQSFDPAFLDNPIFRRLNGTGRQILFPNSSQN